MAFDPNKFVTAVTGHGMQEAQAELLAQTQVDLIGYVASREDVKNLRLELDEKLVKASQDMRREVNLQTQKTRLLIDDVQVDVKKAEARLEGALKTGFATVNYKFNLLAVSNTTVILAVMGFMFFLLRG